MQYFILNLARHSQRWERMEEQARQLGLPVRRVEAVAGEEIPPQDLQRLYSPALNDRQFHRPLVPGEIGCYTSHRRIWRDLLASGEELCAVFEDDVLLSPRLPQVMETLKELPPGWDMIKLVSRKREATRRVQTLADGSSLVSYPRVPSLTAAYVLSRSGAQKLLQCRTPFGRPVDVDLRHWWECGMQIYGVRPYPVRCAPQARDSSMVERRSVDPGLGGRLRKLRYQLGYTTRNWLEQQCLEHGISLPGSARPAELHRIG